MTNQNLEKHETNRDPLSGAAGAHPLGTGLGAAAGGVAGAAVGAVVGGPVGALLGATVGGVAGGLAGKGTAETVNPTVEETYWRENFASRPYATQGLPYEQFASAYRYGWETRGLYVGRRFEDVASDLEHGWDKAKGTSTLAWSRARSATRDAWQRVEKNGSVA